MSVGAETVTSSSTDVGRSRGVFLRSATEPLRDFWRNWQTFWFAPEDPVTLGIIRVLTGWMLFYNLIVWGLDLEAFFGHQGLQPIDAIRDFHSRSWAFSFWMYVPESMIFPVHCGCVLIALCFFLGLATRFTSVAAYIITISYSVRVPIANFGLDQILGFLCLYLAIGPSGHCLSLDAVIRRWWKRRNGIDSSESVQKFVSARVALRLIQLQMCVIYFWAGFAKLKGDSWWTGEAMWQVLANQEYQTLDLTWLAWFPWLPYLIAHATVAWEVSFCVLVWNRHLRPLMLFIGTLMHFGIGAFLGMWTFGLIMTFAYFAFSDTARWRARLQSLATSRFGMLTDHQPAPSIDRAMRPAQESVSISAVEGNIQTVPDETTATPRRFPSTAVSPEFLSRIQAGDDATGAPSETCDQLRCDDSSLLLMSTLPSERTILRKYFRAKDIPLCALTTPQSLVTAVERETPAAAIVSGAGLTAQQIQVLAEDLEDAAGVPVLLLLTSKQAESLKNHSVPGNVLLYPASPREIREAISQMMFADEAVPRIEAELRTSR